MTSDWVIRILLAVIAALLSAAWYDLRANLKTTVRSLEDIKNNTQNLTGRVIVIETKLGLSAESYVPKQQDRQGSS